LEINLTRNIYKVYFIFLFIDFKDGALGLAITIMAVFVVISGINAFYPSPVRNDFCPSVYEFTTEAECIAGEGIWQSTTSPGAKTSDSGVISIPLEGGRCQNDPACYDEYDLARDVHSRNLFLISLFIGIILVFLGIHFFNVKAIGSGIMGGGVITLFYGGIVSWGHSEEWFRFIISLISLAFLVFLAVWFHKQE
jgi:hypothetical protein